MTPLVRDLVELKWKIWGSRVCMIRLVNLATLTFSSWLSSVNDAHSGIFVVSSVVFLLASCAEVSRNAHKLAMHCFYGTGYLGPWTWFDLGVLCLANVAWLVKFQDLEGMVAPISATIMSLVQVFLLL